MASDWRHFGTLVCPWSSLFDGRYPPLLKSSIFGGGGRQACSPKFRIAPSQISMHSKTGGAFKGLAPEMTAFGVLFFHVEGRNLEVPLDRLRPLPAPAAPWLDFGFGFAVSLPATMKADRSGLEGILFKRLIHFHEWKEGTRFLLGGNSPWESLC